MKRPFNPTTRKEQIIEAADVILKQVGTQGFTVDKVVEYLGIAKGTVYKYFQSKDDILAEVSTKALSQLLNYFKLCEQNTPHGLEKTKASIMSCYYYSIDCPEYFELIVHMERPEFRTQSESHKKMSAKLQDHFAEHVRLQQKKGVIRKDIDPMVANYLAWGSCMGMMQFLNSKRVFLQNVEKIEQKDLMESFVDVLVRGMTS